MKKISIYIFFLFFVASTFAQSTKVYKRLDLYFYGKAILLNSSFYLKNITKSGNDLYFLATSKLENNDTLLTEIKNKDIYYLGMGVAKKDTAFLNHIIDKDWYYYGTAMLTKKEIWLKKINNIDIYNLGVAIMRDDMNFLEELNN